MRENDRVRLRKTLGDGLSEYLETREEDRWDVWIVRYRVGMKGVEAVDAAKKHFSAATLVIRAAVELVALSMLP